MTPLDPESARVAPEPPPAAAPGWGDRLSSQQSVNRVVTPAENVEDGSIAFPPGLSQSNMQDSGLNASYDPGMVSEGFGIFQPTIPTHTEDDIASQAQSQPLLPYSDDVDEELYALHDYIERMRRERANLEAAEEYIRADKIRLKLLELFTRDKKMRIARLRRKQAREVEAVKEQFEEERIELVEAYRTRKQNFDGEVEAMRSSLRERQEALLQRETEALEAKHAAVHPKYSSRLLELRYTQAQLLRVGRYKEATKKREEADAQQALEDEKHLAAARQNIRRARKKIKARQATETEILESKIRFGRKALSEAFQLDKDKLTNRQTSILHELELKHKHEVVRLRKVPEDSPFDLTEDGQDIMATEQSGEALYQAQMANKTTLTLDGESILKKYIADEYTVAAGTRTFVPTDTYRQTIMESRNDGKDDDTFDEASLDVDYVAEKTYDADLDLSEDQQQPGGATGAQGNDGNGQGDDGDDHFSIADDVLSQQDDPILPDEATRLDTPAQADSDYEYAMDGWVD